MSIEKVKSYLEQFGRDGDIQEFAVSSATVELAAQALGVLPGRIAKTLTFKQGEGGCIMVVAAGDARIDNAKFKEEFSIKAKMLSPDEVETITGYTIGGVCPFAVENEEVEIYLDASLERFETVYPAAGSSNSAVELSCEELFEYSRALKWIDVCKDWQN